LLTFPNSVPLLTPSAIQDDSGAKIFSPGRTSSTAFLPETDEIVKAVALRAATFQGFLNPSDVEMQITSYNPGQEYKHHYDWYPAERGRNRVSTFFAILRSTCDKCGTEFPFFNVSSRAQYSSSWCDIIDCTSPTLTSLNIEGSAIFWANLDLNRKGRKDMLHAGLPALGGEKVGLNVWADVDIKEIEGRGMFGGWSRMWYRPTREFLKSHGLVKPEEAEGVYKG
jgi:prolyl 4-hydroxylase